MPKAPAGRDSDDIQPALRLGWTITELRGRHRLLPEVPPGEPPRDAKRTDNALPLNAERTPKELAVQAEAVVLGLAAQLKLSMTTADLSYLRSGAEPTIEAELHALCQVLRDAETLEGKRDPWRRLTVFLYAWDAKIQDALAARSLTLIAAYNLGRSVAEAYWTLDPTVADVQDVRSWAFLFGLRRRDIVDLLLRRLSPYIDPLTPPAITASLLAWSDVARDEAWRSSNDTMAALYRQTLLWRDLLVNEISPASLIATQSAIATAGLKPVFWAFRFQVLGLVAAVAVLAAGIALLGSSAGAHPVAAFLTVLGLFGVTTASVAARVKNYAHGLLDEIRLARNTQLVQAAATILPPRLTPPSNR